MTASRQNLQLKLRKAFLIKKLNDYQQDLKTQPIAMNNKKYFKLLSRMTVADYELVKINRQLDLVKRYNRRSLVISMKSKVKLVSTKVEAIIWVDARNYLELVGKKVGDTVMMHNASFQIAGIY